MPSSSLLQFEWTTSINSIPKEEWDGCFRPNDVLNCYDLNRAISDSNLANIQLHYLLAKQHETLVAVTPCFLYTTKLDLLAPPSMQQVLSLPRKLFPNFLLLRVFFVGSPIAICTNSLGMHRIESSERGEALIKLKKQWILKAEEINADMVIVKEIEEEHLGQIAPAIAPEFKIVPSMPKAVLQLDSSHSYESRLKSKHRNTYKSRKKGFLTAELEWEVVHDFSHEAEKLLELYEQVLDKSHTKFEQLNLDFFKFVSDYLRDRSFIIAAKRRGEILSFGLVLVGEDSINPIYLGMEYSRASGAYLYHNNLYRAIEEGERRSLSTICLGQTSYDVKALLGMNFEKLFLAIHPISISLSIILRCLSKIIFPITTIKKHDVFRN